MVERRRHARIALHVPLFLLPQGATEPICTETDTIGVDSLLCHSPLFLAPSERLRFMFFLYRRSCDGRLVTAIRVEGVAEVVRVNVGPAPSQHEIAFQLRSYRVVQESGQLSPQEIAATMALESS